MDFAENMSCHALKTKAFEYVLENIVAVTAFPDFANLSFNTMKMVGFVFYYFLLYYRGVYLPILFKCF